MNRNNFFIHLALALVLDSRGRFRRSTEPVAETVEITSRPGARH